MQRLVLPGIEDSQCGFKMFTASAVRAILPHATVDGWAFDVEMLAIARAQRAADRRGADRVALPERVAAVDRRATASGMLREILRVKARAIIGKLI